MKKYLTYLCCLMFLLTQTACTALLYSDAYTDIFGKKISNTEDSINAFLIDEKKENLVIIGSKYHYIFKTSKDDFLIKMLAWKNRHMLEAFFHYFNVSRSDDSKISGEYFFEIKSMYKNQLEKENLTFLKELGFIGNESPRQKISGTRYIAKSLELKQSDLLSKPYTIHFKSDNALSLAEHVSRIALTPIVVAADGLIVLTFVGAGIVALTDATILTPLKSVGEFFFGNDKKEVNKNTLIP